MTRKFILQTLILALLSAACMSLYSCNPDEVEPKKNQSQNKETFNKKVDPGTDINGKS